MKKIIRIAYTGGGTGGHIYPLLAVADEIQRFTHMNPDTSIRTYYFGTADMYSDEFIKRGISIRRIMSVKLRRYFSIRTVLDCIKFPFALLQALIKLLFVMPDVLFSKGGTSAFPVVFAAWIYRIPIIVHESDTVPGFTNRLSFPFASRIGIAFSQTKSYITSHNVATIGNPIRPFLLEVSDVTQEQAKRILGYDPKLPLILVLGGSQGSSRMNSFLVDVSTQLVQTYQVLHQTGKSNFQTVSQEIKLLFDREAPPYRVRYKTIDFFTNTIRDAFIAADLIITRAGSGALFEIALFGKPSIIIPLPEAAGDHQMKNAIAYTHQGAGILIEEENLKPNLFLSQVDMILKNKDLCERMKQSAYAFATPYAASVLAQEIIHITQKK